MSLSEWGAKVIVTPRSGVLLVPIHMLVGARCEDPSS